MCSRKSTVYEDLRKFACGVRKKATNRSQLIQSLRVNTRFFKVDLRVLDHIFDDAVIDGALLKGV